MTTLTDQEQDSRDERMREVLEHVERLLETAALRGMSPTAVLLACMVTLCGHNPSDCQRVMQAVDLAIRKYPVLMSARPTSPRW